MKKAYTYFCSLLLLLFSSTCFANSLDSPAQQETAPVTVKSELQRAREEGSDARRKGTMDVFTLASINPVKYPSSPQEIVKSCDERLTKLLSENRQKQTATVPYVAGLYAIFWQNTVKTLPNDALNSDLAKQYFTEFRKRQKELNIDNQTFFSFFFNAEYYTNTIAPILEKWIATQENQ